MKFDVLRVSDRNSGRQGVDVFLAGAPCDGAVWDDAENRWEKEVNTLEDLLHIIHEVEAFVLVCMPTAEEAMSGDLPILEIQDEEEKIE